MKKLIASLIIAGFGIGIYGVDNITSHVKATTEGLRDATRTVTTDSYELRRVEKLIQGMDKKIVRFEDKLHDLDAKASEHREAADEFEKTVRKDTAALERERSLLSSGGTTFVLHGSKIDVDRLAASAKARLHRLNANQVLADGHRQHACDLGTAIADGRRQLEQALEVRTQKVVELEQLAVRLENARLKEGIKQMVEPLCKTALIATESELSESLDALDQRVRKAERGARSSGLSLGDPIIEDDVKPAPQDDILRAIDELLGESDESPAIGQLDQDASPFRCANH